MAVQRAASRRRREGPGVYRRPDRFHLQRDVRRRADRRRALYRRARKRLLLVPVPGARRPHESLRARHAAHVRLRLQAALDGRPRLGLAHQLRRPGPVLREGGALHRRGRKRRGDSQRAGRHLSHARSAAGARRPRPARVREAGHSCGVRAPGRHHPRRSTAARRVTTAGSAAAGA